MINENWESGLNNSGTGIVRNCSESDISSFTGTRDVLSVSAITRRIKEILESNFRNFWIEGEISNYKRHSSGHLYFSIKDENAQLRCVMFRGSATYLDFEPVDGEQVVVFGTITVYERRGDYQINITKMIPKGRGKLQLAFEDLKRRLEAEGLFKAEHKKPIPQFPKRIGVVTSPTGAAFRDIIHIIRRRFALVELILYPVQVQGVEAAGEIAGAIKDFNVYKNVDVLIVGRGGGSLEDLWAFNEEIVARAIYESAIPVISAVGHEIDFTISDFVADLRAPTPSAAAELVVKNGAELLENVKNFRARIIMRLQMVLNLKKQQVISLVKSYSFMNIGDRIYQYMQRVDELDRTMKMRIRHLLETKRKETAGLTSRLESLDPCSILKRGYSICIRKKDSKVVIDSKELVKNDLVELMFFRGKATSKITELQNDDQLKLL